MSWSEALFLFGQTATAPTGQVFNYDLPLAKSDPGVLYEGSETNAVYTETREVAGDFWIVSNAAYNGANWIPQNVALPIFATVYRNPGNATIPGYTQRLYCAAGTNPVVWTTLWQIDNLGNVYTGSSLTTTQHGTSASELIDGSTNTITYPNSFQFATSTDQVFLSISNLSDGSALPGTPIILSKSANGFTFAIPGGNVGDTATVDYLAFGH